MYTSPSDRIPKLISIVRSDRQTLLGYLWSQYGSIRQNIVSRGYEALNKRHGTNYSVRPINLKRNRSHQIAVCRCLRSDHQIQDLPLVRLPSPEAGTKRLSQPSRRVHKVSTMHIKIIKGWNWDHRNVSIYEQHRSYLSASSFLMTDPRWRIVRVLSSGKPVNPIDWTFCDLAKDQPLAIIRLHRIFISILQFLRRRHAKVRKSSASTLRYVVTVM